MTAVRTAVMLTGEPCVGVLTLNRDFQADYERASHETELQPCPNCQHEGHDVRWRGYPVLDPGPAPAGGVLDDVVEGCWCCFWGPGPVGVGESLHARLTREAFGGRDVQVEHRDRHGRWTRFEETF